ncbi:hypothetical protein ACEPAG_3310 [Sanghuangporus baumii]
MNSKVKNEALTVQSHPRDTRTCYNCNQTGHIVKFCRSPRKDRRNQNVPNLRNETKNLPKEKESNEIPKSSANAVVDSDSEDWACLAHDKGPNMAINLCRHIEYTSAQHVLCCRRSPTLRRRSIACRLRTVLRWRRSRLGGDRPNPPKTRSSRTSLPSQVIRHQSSAPRRTHRSNAAVTRRPRLVAGAVARLVVDGAVALLVIDCAVALLVIAGAVALLVIAGAVALLVITGSVALLVIDGAVALLVIAGTVALLVIDGAVALLVIAGAAALLVDVFEPDRSPGSRIPVPPPPPFGSGAATFDDRRLAAIRDHLRLSLPSLPQSVAGVPESTAPGFEDWLEEEEDSYGKKKEISVVYQTVLKVSDEPDPPVANERRVILDSGAMKHISPYKEDFLDLRPIDPKPFDTLSKPIHAIGIGTLAVDMPNGDSSSRLNIENVHYAPMSPYTLLSQGSFDRSGFTYSGGRGTCILYNSNGRRIATLNLSKNGLYRFTHNPISRESDHAMAVLEKLTMKSLHTRLGHISPSTVSQMLKNGAVTGLQLDEAAPWINTCESCIYGKATRKEVSKVRHGDPAKKFGEETHSDLWGPSPIQSLGGKHYYVTFTDDATRHTVIQILRTKNQVLTACKQYAKWAETQHGVKLKCLHSDRGGEYAGKEFVSFLDSQGTEQKLTTHDTPEHNGVAECLNQTIGERVRAMLHASGLSKNLWAECAKHAVWLKNRTSTKVLGGKTPHEVLTGEKPNLSGLQEWGTKCWVHNKTKLKLDQRACEGRWLGYDPSLNGSRCSALAPPVPGHSYYDSLLLQIPYPIAACTSEYKGILLWRSGCHPSMFPLIPAHVLLCGALLRPRSIRRWLPNTQMVSPTAPTQYQGL